MSSLFMAGVRNNSIRGKLYLLFALPSGLGPILLAWSGYWGVSVAATVYMGINQAGFMTISHTLIQSLTEDHVRGRVAGVYSVHIGGSMAVTNWINGAIADVFSASAVLVVGGILFFGIVVISSGNTSIRGLYFPKPEQTFAPSTAD